ncbi:MAG: F0F1 ATP synthase subunit gamma [Patescibacteria group bacterium]|nr:F0F1 ATP synthase subunit gamma [Patescibacteria group bacterium]
MLTKRDIQIQSEQIGSLATLVEVYGQIAAERMIKIRGAVLRNRVFLNAINEIFTDTLASYAKRLSNLLNSGKIKAQENGRVTFLAHNGKTVSVFISANTGFYGNVIHRVFAKYLEDLKKDPNIEATIIGRVGRAFFVESMPNTPFTFFDIPDYGISPSALDEAIKHLVQYEEIRIYYAEYKSVINQEPTKRSIVAGTPIQRQIQEPKVEYIFEPSIEAILTFFETQIFASLFDQSLRESQLAKYASRILAMQVAQDNINKRRKELAIQKFKISHQINEKKQINSLAPLFACKF